MARNKRINSDINIFWCSILFFLTMNLLVLPKLKTFNFICNNNYIIVFTITLRTSNRLYFYHHLQSSLWSAFWLTIHLYCLSCSFIYKSYFILQLYGSYCFIPSQAATTSDFTFFSNLFNSLLMIFLMSKLKYKL